MDINVHKCPTSLLWSPPVPITFGQLLDSNQLNAKLDHSCGHVEGTFTYSPPENTALRGGQHTLTVVFSPTDGVHYLPSSAEVSILVHRATPTILWTISENIVYENVLSEKELCAQTEPFVNGTFEYQPNLGTLLPAGQHTLRVTFQPDLGSSGDYSVAHKEVTLTVQKCVPPIVWNASAIRALVYGEALSSVRHLTASFANPTLNETAKFKYSPPENTILPAGR